MEGDAKMSESIRVMIVEDQDLFREMLALSLTQSESIQMVGAFRDAPEALEGAPSLAPDVALLDIELPGPLNGVQLGRRLRRLWPQIGIVLLSSHVDPAFLAAVPDAEIAGWSYLLKNSVRDLDSILRAIQGAAQGMVVLDPALVQGAPARPGGALAGLTPRQQEILHLIATGYSNQAVADQLGLTVKTVENQINRLYQELGVDRADGSIQPRVMAVLTYLRDRQFR